MPNMQGGKKYKSSKHSAQTKAELHEINEADGQMIGRVLRGLGNRRMLVYCNDKIQRVARIRGSMKKGCWISTGDIVLLSIREFGSGSVAAAAASETSSEKADILAKYDASLFPKLKKEPGVNPDLFLTLDTLGSGAPAEEGFVFEGGDEEEEDDGDGSSSEDDKAGKGMTAAKTAERGKMRDLKYGATSGTKEDGSIDIDAI